MPPLALVVEDDKDIRLMFADVLQGDGFDVLTAGSADEAIALLERQAPHIALIDMNMPGGPGTAVLAYMRDAAHLQGTKRIMITANPGAESAAEALGTDLFMVKPVSLRELLTLVRRLITPSAEA